MGSLEDRVRRQKAAQEAAEKRVRAKRSKAYSRAINKALPRIVRRLHRRPTNIFVMMQVRGEEYVAWPIYKGQRQINGADGGWDHETVSEYYLLSTGVIIDKVKPLEDGGYEEVTIHEEMHDFKLRSIGRGLNRLTADKRPWWIPRLAENTYHH